MRLIDAIRYNQGSNIAFVGAGGKTTAIFRTAREILALSGLDKVQQSVFITTTTHLGVWQTALADQVIQVDSSADIKDLEKQLPQGVILFSGEEGNNRISGLTNIQLEQLYELARKHGIPLLIEADGSHLHALKAPAQHEPVIPGFIDNVIVVAGLQGLEKPLTSEWVHRPERFAELAELKIGDQITSDAIVKVLSHPEGGLKGIPASARKIALLNQADNPQLQSQAKRIAERLLASYNSCIISSLTMGRQEESLKPEKNIEAQGGIYAIIEPVGGIILAAGGSSRFGRPKQLLDWNGQPMIRCVANVALKAGLSPIVIVIGSAVEEVAAVINDLPLRIVINHEWRTGLSSSIKAGINSLTKDIGGVIFLQGDQPQIPSSLLRSLIEAHQTSLAPIVAPLIDGQRGNPVLFDRSTLPGFYSLEGDMGGRELFSRFQVQWVNWHDKILLIDIDTPSDYENLLANYPKRKIE